MSFVAGLLKTSANEIETRLTDIVEESKAKDKTIKALEDELAKMKSAEVLSAPQDIDSLAFYCGTLNDVAPDALRSMGDDLKAKGDNVVAVIAGVNGDKANIVAVCGKDAIAKGVKAGDVVREVAKLAGGGGGGRPDSAMAGCKDVSKLGSAMDKAADIVRSMMK